MTSDEQFVVILLGAILMTQRAATAIDAIRGAPCHAAPRHRIVADGYGKDGASTSHLAQSIDLLA